MNLLETLLADSPVLVVTGLPGVGKSHLVKQLAQRAIAAGYAVSLLQWDVSRRVLDTPAVLARHPEVDGVTPPAIRLAVGAWARERVARAIGQGQPGQRLVVEAPLVGHRLAALALPEDDDHEPALSSEACRFLLPVPDRALRAHMVQRRAETIAQPGHPREAADAPPHVVTALWRELLEVGERLGVDSADAVSPENPAGETGGYDPALYEAAYRRILAARHLSVLPMTLDPPGPGGGNETSVYDVPEAVTDCVPGTEEAIGHLEAVEARWTPAEMEKVANAWYPTR